VVLACSSSELPGPSALLGAGRTDALISSYRLPRAATIIAEIGYQHPALTLFAGGPIQASFPAVAADAPHRRLRHGGSVSD